MPAALDVNWGEVRMLAIQIGVREAARRLGVSEDAVLQRSKREAWLATPEARNAAANGVRERLPSALSSVVISPANVLLAELTENGQKSRIALSRGLRKAAEHVQSMDGQEIVMDAQNVKSTAQSLALVHGWQNQAPSPKISLTVTSATESQGMTIDVDGRVMETVEDDPLAGF